MKFANITQMTRNPSYIVHHFLHRLPSTIKQYQDEPPKLNLEPNFQRAHVWTQKQQICYVEFLLRGGNSSRDLYFNCPGWGSSYTGPFEIVDGKQRLRACLDFMTGKIPVFGVHYVKDFSDRPFNVTLHFNINNLGTRSEVLQWYLDINAGGVIHTHEELEKVRELLKHET